MILVRKEKFDSAFDAMISRHSSDQRIIREADTVEDGLSLASQFLINERYTGRVEVIEHTPCTPVSSARSKVLYSLHLNGTAIITERAPA